MLQNYLQNFDIKKVHCNMVSIGVSFIVGSKKTDYNEFYQTYRSIIQFLSKDKQQIIIYNSNQFQIIHKIITEQNMFAFLEKFSLFPYNSLWRISGNTEVNNRFAGFVSILLILALAAIAITKMVEVSKMTSITSTQQTEIATIPPMFNLTTSYNDPNLKQYMFALSFDSTYTYTNPFNSSDLTVSIIYTKRIYSYQKKYHQYQNQTFNLQNCTADHFHDIPDINLKFTEWGMDKWSCFPLNRTFQIGGNRNGNIKFFSISITCTSSACNDPNKSIMVLGYTLNNFVNPTNSSNPFVSYIKNYQIALQANQIRRNLLQIDKNSLITDNSLLPFTSQSTQNSLQTSENLVNAYPTSVSATQFYIIASGKTVTYKRKYLKLLDAFAYLGGIFNALLGAFFFMNISGCFFFQMQIANKLIKKSKVDEVSFMTLFKQVFYSFLAIFKEPDWQASKYVISLRKTVNNLLDIVYLQKRLQFLEKGMQVLFEKHHLKGLYLAHKATQEGADQNFQNYEIDNKFSQYVKEKSKQKNKQKLKEGLQTANNPKDSNKALKIDNSLESNIKFDTKVVLEDFKESNAKKLQNMIELEVLSQKKQKIRTLSSSDDSENSQKYALKEEEILALLKLCKEAKQKKGDSRSQRIYEKIDSKMREALQAMLYYENPIIPASLST